VRFGSCVVDTYAKHMCNIDIHYIYTLYIYIYQRVYTQYMLSDHCDLAYRVIVGRADLFGASHALVF
jgi:hypothetical protein